MKNYYDLEINADFIKDYQIKLKILLQFNLYLWGIVAFFGKDKYRDSFEMLRGDGIKIMLDEYDMVYFGLY